MGEHTSHQSVAPEFRQHAGRMKRLRDVQSLWQLRLDHLENLVMDSFQAQDLDKISELISEKKWLERRIVGLANFLSAQGNDE